MDAIDARSSRLTSLDEALRLSRSANSDFHRRHLNPRFAALAELAGFDEIIVRAEGPYLWDEYGERYLDLVCGYGAVGLGHNHPRIRAALSSTEALPNLMQGLNPLAAALAHNLATLAPGKLDRVNFAHSGAEAVDMAIKLARAATGRQKLVACRNGFHGRSIGALSLTQRRAITRPFGPLLPGVSWVPHGDSAALSEAVRGRDVAAFLIEPIQGEGGIVVPPPGYLAAARELCARYGTLFVADEVQTGLGRTGSLFAVEADHVEPDVLLLGKILGAGVMPLSAVLTTEAHYRAAGGSTVGTPFASSTYGINSLASAVGLAAVEVLLDDRLAERAAATGNRLMERLRDLQCRQPLIAEVRGRGLMVGVAFAGGTGRLADLLTAGAAGRLARSYFASFVSIDLMRRHRIITATTLNDPNVLRIEPPLNVDLADLERFVAALEDSLYHCRSFLHVARKEAPRLLGGLRA
jgi:putrescine aminotransferase